MDTTKWQKVLETEKDSLERELKAEKADAYDSAGMVETRDEVAEKFEDEEERAATKQTLTARLEEVKAALTRIERSTYGRCEVGNEPIEEDRLEANPAARTCKQHLGNLNG